MTLLPSGTSGSGSGGSSRSVCGVRAEAAAAGDAMRNRVCSVSSGWLPVAGTVTGISYCSKGGAGTLVGRCGMSSSPETAIHPSAATGGGAFGHRTAERPGGGERAVERGVDGPVRLRRRRRHERREQAADLGYQLGRGVRRRAEVDVAPLGSLEYLELVQRGEGRRRQEAVGPAARHREIGESVAELLVLLRHRAGGGALSAEERRGRLGRGSRRGSASWRRHAGSG